MRTIFMGTPSFAVPVLQHLVLNGYEVVAVYTQPDRPAGRGRAPVAPPVKEAAVALGLPVLQPASLKQPGAIKELASLKPDVIVVTAFGQILPQAVLDIPRHGCLNLHFSLLPRFRGASPVAAAILAGDEFTGVTIMLIELALDAGPVLAQAAVPVLGKDTTASLTFKLGEVGARFLPGALEQWLKGEITPRPQDKEKATYFGTVKKEDGKIDWHLSAVDIWRRVRAYYPWPGAYTTWQGKRLKIIEAVPLPAAESGEVGQVTPLNPALNTGAAFGIRTGDGILGVLKVQMEGKQVMSASDFLRGQRGFVGQVLA